MKMKDFKKERFINDMLVIRYGKKPIAYEDIHSLYIIEVNEIIEKNCYGRLLEELASCYKWAIVDEREKEAFELYRQLELEVFMEMDIL